MRLFALNTASQRQGWTSLVTLGMVMCLPVFALGQVDPPDRVRSPSEIDGSRVPSGDPAATPSSVDAATLAQRANAAELLFRELDNLIPGEFIKDSEPEQAIRKAVAAFQDRQAQQVIAILEEQAKLNVDYPPADVLLAALSFSSNDEKTGRLLLERASMAFPDNPAVYSAFSRMAINGQRTTDAKVLFEELQRRVQSAQLTETARKFYTTQYLDGLIDVALTQKRYADARQLLDQQRVLLPEHPKVMMVSAELEFKEDNLEGCLDFLRQLKQKFPNTRAPEAIVASWYQRTGQAELAAKWIQDAAAANPKDPQVQLEFASWALNEEDFPSASAAIRKAEDVTQETPYSRNLKGKIAFAQQSYGVAEAHFEALMASQPMDSDLSNMYALTLIESTNPDKRAKAIGIATRNLQAMPNNRVALASLGYIQLKLGQLEQAAANMTRVSQSNGTSPEIDYFIASFLKQVGDKEKAKQFLGRALQNKGLFLYRSAALTLQKELNTSEQPNPTTPVDPGK